MNKTLGDKIRQLRLIRGLNQDNIAEELNMSAGNYGKIERGEVSLSIEKLQRISEIFEVKISDFFDESTPLIQKAQTKDSKSDKDYINKSEFNLLVKEVEILYEKVENLKIKIELIGNK